MRRTLAAVLSAVLAVGTAVVLQVSAPPADALDNGLALTPPMGFNNWNSTHCGSGFDETMIKGIADLFVSSGLKDAGYEYVNIDDCWALPQRGGDGNLVPDPKRFPNGIKALADYVHDRGLKLGIYTSAGTKTCNSAGFPGALGHEEQDAQLFASWGIDYLKYDNCNNQGVDAVQRYTKMRDALKATGRPIVFSICEWGQNKPWLWAKDVGHLWRTTGDINDTWAKMLSIMKQNLPLAQYAGPGHWNDPDMLEVGNGGMTTTEYRTHFSMWSVMAAPLLIGSDLRKVSPQNLEILLNREVIAVDQDPLGVQGSVLTSDGGRWVVVKPLAGGDRAVALFNETNSPATISTTVRDVGLSGDAPAYALRDLWTHETTETAGAITATVPPHATVMYRVSPAKPTAAPPNATIEMTGLDDAVIGKTVPVTVSFTDNGVLPAQRAQLSLAAPKEWDVQATTPTTFPAVESGQTVRATWQVTARPPSSPFGAVTVGAAGRYEWPEGTQPVTVSTSRQVETPTQVQPPYHTFASTTASFGQAEDSLGIRAAGSDVYGATNQYGAIYLPNTAQNGTTTTVKVTAQAATNDWAKAGIMVRDNVTQAGSSPGFVILAVTPGHGYVMQWDADGDGHLDSSAPAGQETGTAVYPSWLRLSRTGTAFTGSYSTDGTTWQEIGTAHVPSAAATQDAGVFATAHGGTVGEADFAGLTVGPPSGLLDARSSTVAWPGQASPVEVTFYDHGSAPVDNVAVTLTAPAGWTVDPSGPTALGRVAAGGHQAAGWHVTPPADAAPVTTPLSVVATYDDGGKAARSEATVTAVIPSSDLAAAYNNVGITDDHDTSAGDIDGAGSSLSAQALAAAGVTPGSIVDHGGAHFPWPNVPTGKPDNVVAHGQSFQLSGSGSTLGFLATSTYGPASGTGTIDYTDGTTQQFTLTVPDWYSNPPAGSDPAITMTYRNRAGNTQQAHAINVFYVGVPLQKGKTVRGLVLPDVSGTPTSGVPAMHVFAIAVG